MKKIEEFVTGLEKGQIVTESTHQLVGGSSMEAHFGFADNNKHNQDCCNDRSTINQGPILLK